MKLASEHKSITHRILVSSCADMRSIIKLKSLDLVSPWFGHDSCARELNFPFKEQHAGRCFFLGSSNGLVFVSLDERFYIWTPSTRFFKKLPDIVYSENETPYMTHYGAWLLSATDDYKILAGYMAEEQGSLDVVHIFSLRAHIWRKIETDAVPLKGYMDTAFPDLVKKEFRIMGVPDFEDDSVNMVRNLGVVGGCLCISISDTAAAADSIDFWIMKEYGVRDTWTKLFNLNFSILPVGLLRGEVLKWFVSSAIKYQVRDTWNKLCYNVPLH